MAVAGKLSTLHLEENHYMNREVDELDEQKVNKKHKEATTKERAAQISRKVV